MIDYIAESKVNYNIRVKTKVNKSEDIFNELQELKDAHQEHFVAVYLDGANNIIETRVITIGTLNQSLIHPREVFYHAIKLRARSLIVAHNHPSGALKASDEDIQATKRLKETGKIIGIELLDHIIFCDDGFISLREETNIF